MYSALNLSGNGRSAIRPAESKQSGTQPPSPPSSPPPSILGPRCPFSAPERMLHRAKQASAGASGINQTQAHSYTHARAHKHTYREHKIKVIVAGPARVISSKLLLLIIGSKQEEGAEGVPRRSRSSRSLMHLPPALASRRRGPARSRTCAPRQTYMQQIHTYYVLDTSIHIA